MEKTKEQRDLEWSTCKLCGVKDGEQSYNWVFDGKCRKCKDKEEADYDFKQARIEGKITRDDSIMCPYCGYIDNDCCEMHRATSFHCPKCEKESSLNIEYTAHFTTSKVDGE